jgi:colicin import membrane protein
MNKHYIIWPVVMIALFVAYFMRFEKEFTVKEAARIAETQRVEAEKAAEKKRLQDQAAIENKKQSDLKAQEEAEKIAKRKAEQDRKDQAVRDDTAARVAEINAMAKEKGMLEAKLAETRRARLKAEADAFDAARSVELAKIERRTIELEIQRAAGLVAAKVDASSLVEIPVFATESAKK